MAKKKQLPEEVAHSEAYVKDFFDMAVPSAIRFNVDHFICGDSYRSVWAIREYPPQTSDQALLARFGDKEAVTVHLYTRLVDGVEQRKILQNASRKNKLLANSNDLEDSVTGEGNLGDVVELLGELRKNREPLLHCAVFIELSAGNLDKLRELQSDVSMEMTREKISVDHLSMRQKEGFIACMPCGYNIFGTQYERVLPASAVANLFPFNYSGKTDKNGFYLGNQHIEDRTACDSHYYREDRIMDAFIGIINRLRFAEEGIIAESIELTEKAILLKKRNNLQALESSQSMAELNAKLLMLEQLKSKGYLAPDVFESQSREINGQINEIKTKRIQSLSSTLDVALEEFKTLQARLNEIDEPLNSFDPKLFEEVIKGMTVNNRDEMTFRLIGDLTFTVRL